MGYAHFVSKRSTAVEGASLPENFDMRPEGRSTLRTSCQGNSAKMIDSCPETTFSTGHHIRSGLPAKDPIQK
jgi:hypothetical protein